MVNNETGSAGDQSPPLQENHLPPDATETFPTQAVVGVIDAPGDLYQAVEEFRAGGFDPGVLHGDVGADRIRNAGDTPRDLRMTRLAQGMLGYEADHTERYMHEVEAGNFVVVLESHDDQTTERLGHIFAAHGGRFVNYYTRWTSRVLLP